MSLHIRFLIILFAVTVSHVGFTLKANPTKICCIALDVFSAFKLLSVLLLYFCRQSFSGNHSVVIYDVPNTSRCCMVQTLGQGGSHEPRSRLSPKHVPSALPTIFCNLSFRSWVFSMLVTLVPLTVASPFWSWAPADSYLEGSTFLFTF